MFNSAIWIMFGAVIGPVASRIFTTDGRQSTLIDIAVGCLGAFIAGLTLTQQLGFSTLNDYGLNPAIVIVAIVGAIALVALVKFCEGVVFNQPEQCRSGASVPIIHQDIGFTANNKPCNQ